MDKILVSPDGDITVTNDGATILGQMEVELELLDDDDDDDDEEEEEEEVALLFERR